MDDDTCCLVECNKPRFRRDWCAAHYSRWLRHGDPRAMSRRAPGSPKEACELDECEAPQFCKGLCNKHYARWRKHGDPRKVVKPHRRPAEAPRLCFHCDSPVPKRRGSRKFCASACTQAAKGPCSFDDCGKPVAYRKLCAGHVEQQRLGRPLTPLQRARSRGAVLARDAWGRKECPRCLTWKPEGEFSRQASSADGLGSNCRVCVREKQRTIKYTISEDRYQRMLTEQAGLCAICKAPPADRALAIDHDHRCCPDKNRTCGRCIRALLCNNCNMAIGLMRDSAELLAIASAYVASYSTPPQLALTSS